MSNTKCYRFADGNNADDLVCMKKVDAQWFVLWKNGYVERANKDENDAYDRELRDGSLAEVPDPSWPIIDGSPKNPAAFEALYRAAKEAVEQFDYMIELQPEVKDEFYPNCASECDSRREKTTAALALADKGVGQ